MVRRNAFTLVELLVVMAVIGVLLAIVLPAIGTSSEVALRMKCMNNQGEIAKALLIYENDRGRFPGYLNWLGNVTQSGQSQRQVSWLVTILPEMSRNDVYERWVNLGVDPYVTAISHFVCPSDVKSNPGLPWLSYVGNCGIAGVAMLGSDVDMKKEMGDGIFTNRTFTDTPPATMTLAQIISGDGISQTLLVSESLADKWSGVFEHQLGFLWSVDEGVSEADTLRVINQVDGVGNLPFEPASSPVKARPSSRHPGGVIVAFADGHCTFLMESIKPIVYRQLCTPKNASSSAPLSYILREGDYLTN